MQNNENYSGFDLTMYNLFTLLREMYYTRGETETNFLQKSGGVLSGSLTIQGNLVINGQSYTIDTENLKVGDYTITLAKDNEQTLTSMVGMVVPKYDGTNYGFFGWDADGYAYVGDLTNWDGSSAITLANNSSLQKISTIDTTNTVVASNGVIYVYDATSHCFKKPTNDNKYYVIRNGAFVETELFTEQKSKNIDNALYNLGAYDTYSVSNGVVSVVRQTGYLKAEDIVNSLAYESADLTNPRCRCDAAISSIVKDLGKATWNLPNEDNALGDNNATAIATYINGSIYFRIKVSGSLLSSLDAYKQYIVANNVEIQYKLSTTYTDTYIENTPNIALDQNGANWLQNEWKKGLNLCDSAKLFVGYTNASGELTSTTSSDTLNTDYIFLKAGTYTISSTLPRCQIAIYNTSKVYQGGYSWTTFTFTMASDGYVRIGINDQSQTFTSSNTYLSATYKLMLNEGTHTYPYSAYNGEIVHKADIEPVLLWENSSPNSAWTDITNAQTVKDMSKYKYIVIAYKYYSGSDRTVAYKKIQYAGTTTGTISDIMNNGYFMSRAFILNSATQITFAGGYYSYNNNSDSTNVIIPIAIYGTNVL